MYYITMMHDNVEEVVSVHPTDDITKVFDYLHKKYGEIHLSDNPSGSVKAVPVNNKDIYFTIIDTEKRAEATTDWRETSDLLELKCSDNKMFELESNMGTWNRSKVIDHPLFVHAIAGKNTIRFGLGLEEMIKLRDYLNQKIEFLSE